MPIFFPKLLTFFPSRLLGWRKNAPIPAFEILINALDCLIYDRQPGLVPSSEAALQLKLGFKNALWREADHGLGAIHGRWKACSAGRMP
jgi:hypothetical protein